MKKLGISILIVLSMLVATIPAMAAGKSQSTFAVTGTISAINGNTITVFVNSGNKLAKSSIGKNLDITTNSATRFLLRSVDGVSTTISLSDLTVGQSVSVNGKVVNNVWTAKRVTAGALLIHLP